MIGARGSRDRTDLIQAFREGWMACRVEGALVLPDVSGLLGPLGPVAAAS